MTRSLGELCRLSRPRLSRRTKFANMRKLDDFLDQTSDPDYSVRREKRRRKIYALPLAYARSAGEPPEHTGAVTVIFPQAAHELKVANRIQIWSSAGNNLFGSLRCQAFCHCILRNIRQ